MEKLNDSWQLYESEQTEKRLYSYLDQFHEEFNRVYDAIKNQTHIEGPHLTLLPDELLPVAGKYLFLLNDDPELTESHFTRASSIVRCLTVLCRNFDNIPFINSCDFIGDILMLASRVVCSDQDVGCESINFLHDVLTFFECLYDPYFVWRTTRNFNTMSYNFQPALLHLELIPFFYDCFQSKLNKGLELNNSSEKVLSHCAHLFGATLSALHNAHKLICPATMDILFKVLIRRDLSFHVKNLVLKCILMVVSILEFSTSDQQVELSAVIDDYHKCLTQMTSDLERNLPLFILMLDKLKTILPKLKGEDSPDYSWLDLILGLFVDNPLSTYGRHDLFRCILRVIPVLLQVSKSFKLYFTFDWLKSVVEDLTPLPDDILDSLLRLAEEIGNGSGSSGTEAVIIIFHLLPSLTPLQQERLAPLLLTLCCQQLQSRLRYCKANVIDHLTSLLESPSSLTEKTTVTLIQIVKHLGRDSISGQQLKRLLGLLRPLNNEPFYYARHLIRALSAMAKREGYESATDFWDFQDLSHGIVVPSIQRMSSSRFSFHVWLRLDSIRESISTSLASSVLYRRLLYSFHTSSGMGFEAFFLSDGILLVAVCIKKKYFTVNVMDTPLDDGLWHSVLICHATTRRPFTQSQLCVSVYFDGRLKANVQLLCPSLTEPFTYCRIGSPGIKTNVRDSNENSVLSTSERLLSTFPAFFSSREISQYDTIVKVIPTKLQDKIWGPQQHLRGQVSSVALLNEALTASQAKELHMAGVNSLEFFLGYDLCEIDDMTYKLVFCYYAKASHDSVCSDLSLSPLYEGRVTCPCYSLHDIRDSINCIGGVYALFPILSLVCSADVGVSPPHSRPTSEDEDWTLLPNNHYSDDLMQRNMVASFLILLRNFIKNHTTNQEHLLNGKGIQIISDLLLQVPDSSIDVNVLMAVQSLIESLGIFVRDFAMNELLVLNSIIKHILLNFAIWDKSDFPVRIGHIQYLSTIIKDDQNFFRDKYGVQFLLDVIRQYYSVSSSLSIDDMHTIRGSLFGLIKYLISDGVRYGEVCGLIGFIISVKNDDLVCELLDTLITVVDKPSSSDETCGNFLVEITELLFGVVVNQNLSTKLRCKVLKFLMVLVKSDNTPESKKGRIRLEKVGIPGLTNFLPTKSTSVEMVTLLVDFVSLTDKPYTYQGLLSLLHLTRDFDVSVKLQLALKVLKLLKERPTARDMFAKQPSWQDSMLCLLVKLPVNVVNTSAIEVSRESIPGQELVAVELPSTKEEFVLPPTPPIAEVSGLDLSVESDEISQSSRSEYISVSTSKSGSVSGRNSCNSVDHSDAESCHESLRSETQELPHSLSSDETELAITVATNLTDIFWHGVGGSNSAAWMERGCLFTCINLWALNNELIVSHVTLKRLILEQALKNAISDINSSSGQSIASHSENARELMRWLYDFIVVDPNKDHNKKFSVNLLEGVLCLLDTLLVFEESPALDTWIEMTHLGYSFLIACAACDNLEICALATPKLHALVQARSLNNLEEAGFLLGSFHSIITRDVLANEQEHYSFLVPILKALIEKTGSRLGIRKYLPSFPSSQPGPSFFEDFQTYSQSEEWILFIEKQVKPLMEKFGQATLNSLPDAMNDFWNQCYEATMIAIHKRNREWGECKLKFQSKILQPFNKCRLEEKSRYQQVLFRMKSHSKSIKRQWQQLCINLMGPQGPWPDSSRELHWKLMPNQNLSRMRLKLGINFNFNNYLDASQLRDNLEIPQKPSESLPLSLALEAKPSDLQDDGLEEEELNLPAVLEKESSDFGFDEKLILKKKCELITLMSIVKGRFVITTTHICFYDLSPVHEDFDRQDFKLNLSQLREIHLRRYNLRRSALELFLVDQTNYFLNFSTKARNKVYSRLISLRPVNLFHHTSRSPAELLRTSGLTQKWVQREISNFDYLMQLNTIAGRTYNDLSQYPVFPWVLSDFTSEILDLNDPGVFRDLSKPIGVVNPKKIAEVKAKYEDFEDSTGTFAKFHYGTHYSNSAGVLHYLVRMEPFTSLHVELQSGRFDVADRQFHSIPGTWRMLMESSNDVKELIPEFFYLPEFLLNMNNFDLGILQESKKVVGDVELPPWATDVYDFIHKHRQALESDHVSRHLHEWIDLIFGYKQKGEEAIKALNVFFYCSYEGAVDLDSISDEFEREQLEKMINNFGQTPCQLLQEPHPQRLPMEQAKQLQMKDLTRPPSMFLFLEHLKANYVEVSTKCDPLIFVTIPRSQVRSFIQQSLLDNLVTISRGGLVGVHGWLPYDKFVPQYFTFEKDPTLTNAKTRRKVNSSFLPGIIPNSCLFVVTHDARLLLTGGHWDNTVRCFSLIRWKIIGHVIGHSGVVTCLALDHFGTRLVSGSSDTTICVWQMIHQGGICQRISSQPLRVLVGHSTSVTCVSVMSELDVVVSGSENGSVIIHSMLSGFLLKTLQFQPNFDSYSVSTVALSEFGQLVAVYQSKSVNSNVPRSELCVFSINGCRLSHESSARKITSVVVVGSNVVIGTEHGQLYIKEIYRLRLLSCLSLHHRIEHISVSPRETHLLICLEDGKLIVVGACPRIQCVSNELKSEH